MDAESLFKAIAESWHSLGKACLIQSIVTFAVATATSGSALIAFAALAFIGLLTRLLALCYQHLRDCGKYNDLYNCIMDIYLAIKAGLFIQMP